MTAQTNQEVAYESAATPVAFAALTPNGPRKIFTAAAKPWSSVVATVGVEPYVIAPYGLITGGEGTPAAAGGNNNVDVAALTAMMPAATGADPTTGILSVAAATNVACARGAGASTAYIINSITINASGTIAVVTGTGAELAHTATRGGAGGPPSIPLGSVEVYQVRYTSHTAAPVLASEIFAVPGTHQERYDFPVWNTDPIRGTVEFADAMPLIHGATATSAATAGKLVYARYATPIFAVQPRTRDFVPAETTNSTSSEALYDNVNLGSVSSSIGQASFVAKLVDGMTDAILGKVGQNLLFRFKPDKNRTPYIITQGILGVGRTFPVGGWVEATFTISPSQASVNFPS
jgi:hypothetical protein